MATITKRGDYQYQAKVRRKGFPTQTKTFERKRDAQDWATIIESEMRHEAASRIAPSVETATLAKIMGWKNIQMAMRYYNPTAKELVTAIRGVTKTSDSYSPSETFDSTCD